MLRGCDMEITNPVRPLHERLIFLLAAIAIIIGTFTASRLVLSTRTGTVDSYYYFARAAELNEGVSLADTKINWGPEGVDRKFFPGYPLLQSWLTFDSQPERSWRTLSVLLVLVDSVLLGFALRSIGLSFFTACAGVAMFASHPIPLRWMSMPMAEGSALLYLCLSAILLPKKEDSLKIAYPRFLLACGLGGMAILCRAEASYIAAALGLIGVARMWKRPGWWAVATGGLLLGVLPMFYWLSTLPAATGDQSRLHYVNEFKNMFSWRDTGTGDGAQGGVIDNFGRSWLHVVRGFGRNPFARHQPENQLLLGFWAFLFAGPLLFSAFGFVGKLAQRFSIVFIGFIIFRSFWYYPYDRFLITGLPIGFGAMALMAESITKRSRWGAVVGTALVFIWCARSIDQYMKYHMYERVPENGAHSYRDDFEVARLQWQMEKMYFPLEGADMSVLAARRISKSFQTNATGANDAAKREEVVAMEFPWPQVAYALRPRPVIVGYPFVNFWGDAEYMKMERVPLDKDKNPIRTPRRAVDFLRDRNVKYVITPQPRTLAECNDEKDRIWGTWFDWKGVEENEKQYIQMAAAVSEREEIKLRQVSEGKMTEIYEWPRIIRIFALKFPPR
ncbi:MAG: hypothetical protein ACKVS6_10630 [Planctomycetota bacterium]